MPGPPSLPHLAAIAAVLRALQQTTYAPYEADRAVPHALIVIEDVAVALQLGYQLGLSLDSIVAKYAELRAEFTAEQDAEDVARPPS